MIFFFTCFGGFLKQGFKRDISLFCLGRELYSIEGHVVLKDNGFILDRASFIRKLFWNKAYLAYFIIKRKQPVKWNATQNRKERQCLDSFCKLQVPKLAFWARNASKTLATSFSNWMSQLWRACILAQRKKDRSLKHATILRYKRLWKRDTVQNYLKEYFFPPLQEEQCIKTTVLNTQLLPWWRDGLILQSKRHLHRWYLTFTFRQRLQSCGYLIQTEVDYGEEVLLGTVLTRPKRTKKEEVDYDGNKCFFK